MAETAPDPMIGRRIGVAVVVELVGEGGMGAVYRADHPYLKKSWAVKVILPELAQNRQAVDRFLMEARAAASVEHPRIVQVMDFGFTEDGRPFQVMPLLTGRDLNDHCWEVGRGFGHPGRLPLAMAGPLYLQILDGIAAAHEHRIVHRDLKGSNIQVLNDGTIKILDFGIAKLFDPALRTAQKTGTFQILGSPGYVSPEQARGRDVDHRTDIYALGVILYRMLTGRLPFDGDDLVDIVTKALTTVPSRPSELVPEIPAAISETVLACLAPLPDDRPDSVYTLAHSLMDLFPGGRSLASEIAPDLVKRSGPNDATVKPWTPLAHSEPHVSPLEAKGTRWTVGPSDVRSPSAAVQGTVWTVGSSDLRSPALSIRRSRRPIRRAVLAIALILTGSLCTAALFLVTRDRVGPSETDPAIVPEEPRPVALSKSDAGGMPSEVKSATNSTATGTGSAFAATWDAGLGNMGPGNAAIATAPPDTKVASTPPAPDSTPKKPPERPTERAAAGLGTLTVEASPFAEIWIDGQHVGSTPITQKIAAGRHSLKLQRPDGTVERIPVVIRAGQETRVTRFQ